MTVTTQEKTAYPLTRWDLSELLPETSETTIASRFAALEAAVVELEARRAALAPGMDRGAFLDMVRRYDELMERMNELSGYAALWFYGDTGSSEALTFRNRVRQTTTAAFNRILFFTLWWRGLCDAEAEALLPSRDAAAGDVRLADYRHYLIDLRRLQPHTLDEKSEQIINLK